MNEHMDSCQVRARIPNKLKERLDNIMEKMKKNLPRGAEINISSVIRGSLEKFVEDAEKANK